MTPALAADARGRISWAIGLGAWAAAIVLAPNQEYKLALAAPAILVALALWTLDSPGRWVSCFFAAALLLPPLPIALGDSGPHLCLFFAALGVLSGIVSLARWRIPATPLNVSLGMLFVLLLVSVAPAAVYSGAAIAAGSFARVALFGIAVYAFFYTAYGPGAGAFSSGSIRGLYRIAVASALFACIDFYFQFPAPAGYASQFVWLDSGVYRRAQGFFYEAGTLGNFCAFFLALIATALAHPWARTIASRKALALGGSVFF